MRRRRFSRLPALVVLSAALCLVPPRGAAAEGEAETAPPPEEIQEDPDQMAVAYAMLRPVNTLGWTFTGLGLTGLGLGFGASLDGVDLGPIPAVGRVLFMSSLFVTTIVGSVALQMLPYEYRGRPARTVAAVTFAVGVAALVTDSVLRLVFAATNDSMPLPLTVSLQAVGLGSLAASSLTTLIDNEVLMGQLRGDRDSRGGATAARHPGLLLLPTPLRGGGGAAIVGIF